MRIRRGFSCCIWHCVYIYTPTKILPISTSRKTDTQWTGQGSCPRAPVLICSTADFLAFEIPLQCELACVLGSNKSFCLVAHEQCGSKWTFIQPLENQGKILWMWYIEVNRSSHLYSGLLSFLGLEAGFSIILNGHEVIFLASGMWEITHNFYM